MRVNVYEFEDYVGFWCRILASLIDLAIIGIVLFVVNDVPYSELISALLVVAYLVGGNRWRLGCRILGIKIISVDGAEVSLGQSIVRILVSPLSVLVFGLGYLWIAGDPNRQAWHDKIAGTYVIRRRAEPTGSANFPQAHPIKWRFAIPCMLIFIALPLAIAGGMVYWLVSSETYRVAKAYLADNPAIIAKVGQSPEFGWLPSGEMSESPTGGQALLDVDVHGDVGELVAQVALTKQEGSWKVVEAGYYDADGELVAIPHAD